MASPAEDFPLNLSDYFCLPLCPCHPEMAQVGTASGGAATLYKGVSTLWKRENYFTFLHQNEKGNRTNLDAYRRFVI